MTDEADTVEVKEVVEAVAEDIIAEVGSMSASVGGAVVARERLCLNCE